MTDVGASTARSKRAGALEWGVRSPQRGTYDERGASSEGTGHLLRRRCGGHVGRSGKVFTIGDRRQRLDAIPGEFPDDDTGPRLRPTRLVSTAVIQLPQGAFRAAPCC
jgi:hypothetical protein